MKIKIFFFYFSDTPQTKMKYEHESMVELYLDQGCNEASSSTIEKDLVIPRILMSSNNSYCRVVQVTYELKVKGISSGCNGNIEMSFPITIGSVPLSFHQTTTLQAPHQNNFVIATAPMPNGHKNNFVAPTSMPELRKLAEMEISIISFFVLLTFSSPSII